MDQPVKEKMFLI